MPQPDRRLCKGLRSLNSKVRRSVCYPQNRPALLTMPTPMFLASSYYKDKYLAYEFERNPRLDKSGNESMNHCLIYELLWRDYTLKGKSPTTFL